MIDFGLLRYFLKIEVVQFSGLFLSQNKYLTHLLEDTGTLGSTSIDAPTDSNMYFDQNLRESLVDPEKYT